MTSDKRMSDAELTKLRDRLDIDDAFGWRPQILALLNHIDAIRTELTAIKERLGERFMHMTGDGPFCELCDDNLPHKTDCPLTSTQESETP